MESSTYLKILKEKLIADSASWGSLFLLGITVLMLLMLFYSQGELV